MHGAFQEAGLMPRTDRARFWLTLLAAFVLGGTAKTFAQADAANNSQPNPYLTVGQWGTLPEGRTWGSSSAVDIAPDGTIWVAERCGANTCAGSDLAPVLHFDLSGKLLTSFGAGLFVFPHG